MARWWWAGLLAGCALGTVAAPSPTARAADADVSLAIENSRFSPAELRVKAGAPFVLVVTNKDRAVEEFESQDLRIEKLVPAGKTVRIRVPALKPGTYSFVGEYHEQTAKGRIVAE